ncbi:MULTISPECIES: Fur family transcriptional regulator [unclassified Paracoccus (in: a-proteobacteria)]|uniref:Fur family transcriptional regulator n=1 Tax=unclassified Paracoccus (in: a-proteobacteria) TaxID=2688777 RepID=UPI0016014A18|nr:MULTISPECIES: Fur family transcriptional regulator [unclassified Paracoccus (in: a-proteobacteria)]MBB1491288.1 transcriptional repressor [Paracoccus sp. MC1854]MBB1498066.1 transcriptional repressor [Paracoccus sp. MC1862]QQO43496.1 transcriptional repressor [Paracoccus sp. MC1862]
MSAHTTDFAQALRDAGLRVTQQRMVLLAILMDSADHPNADELLARARAVDDSVSLATVYRTLSALEEAGLIRKLTLESEPSRYEITPAAEHDHVVDIDTGEVIEIASDEIARLRREMLERLGFEIVSQHTLIRARRIRKS